MHVLILAAGNGTRLGRYAADQPKCLTELAGATLLERNLQTLATVPGLTPTVVGGARAEQLRPHTDRVVVNERAAQTNIVGSLAVGMDALAWPHDVLVVYGDIVYEPDVLTAALTPVTAAVTLPINTAWKTLWQQRMPDPLADAETLQLSADGAHVTAIGGRPAGYHQIRGQFMGILRLHPPAVDWMRRQPREHLEHLDTTSMLAQMITAGLPVAAIPVAGRWLEVDTEADLEIYRTMHAAGTLDVLCRLSVAQDHR